ncbi:MAG: type II toxin-antitoxin system HicB family antitoxin [Firmicutes bacterium]|nr:type II toxin-antitoxin system HicB family antitoxin [Bacillota bacterium]
MPKFTYPVVFIHNEEGECYNAFLPDLGVFSIGDTMEEAYADAEKLITKYFQIATAEDFDFATPTSLEDITKKWKGYKVSLLTANLPDAK